MIAVVRAGARGDVLDAFAGRPPEVARREPAGSESSDLDQLTPPEREVVQHIARGDLSKQTGRRPGISAKTVEAHVSAVLRKLQLPTRHELTRWASERLEPPGGGNARW